MVRRLLYLVRLLLFFILVFFIGKIIFVLYNANGGPESCSMADFREVVRHGFSLDFSTSLYFVVIPLLVVLASLWVKSWKVLRGGLKVYYLLIALLVALAVVADAALYEFWHFKLDSSFFQYLDATGDAFASVSTGYLVVRLLAVALLVWAIWKGLVKITPQELSVLSIGKRVTGTLICLLLIPLMVIGIRGGLDVSTTNIGQVYYSENQFLNHSAVNPVFSFLSSLDKVSKANETEKLYHFYESGELEDYRSRLFAGGGEVPADTLLNTRTPNILLVLMEGCGGRFTYLRGDTVTMPHLLALSREGIAFDSCYANSFRTDRGLVCALSGYESFPTVSVMKVPSKSNALPSLARSLKRAGYSATFVYGGDANFTNMRSYLMATGYERIVAQEDFSGEERGSSKWGVTDSITFSRTLELYEEAVAAGNPVFMTLLTLSSHEPWTVPYSRIADDPIKNSFGYLDWCIGKFMTRLKQSPAWDNTVVIFVPDHDIALQSSDPGSSHIPQIWCGGAVRSPRVISTLCNQNDLPATLLGQLGLEHGDFAFSRNVLSSGYREHLAVHYFNNGFCVWDDAGFSMYDFNADAVMKEIPESSPERIRRAKAVLQMVAEDFSGR